MKFRLTKQNVKKFLQWAAVALLVFAVISAEAVVAFDRRHKNQPDQIGVSFSSKYAKELGLEPNETFLALLDDLKVRQFRLMSYWDDIENTNGVYDFKDLDFQMNEAAKRGAKVSLAMGLRQPRWPECHFPSWAAGMEQKQWEGELYEFVGKVAERYRTHAALASYQLENEAFNRSFAAPCEGTYSRSRIREEQLIIKRLDPHHAIITNISNRYSVPLTIPIGERFGFSVYHRVYDKRVPGGYFNYPLNPFFYTWRAAMLERYWRRPVIVHELQAEPWGPRATKDLSVQEQNQSMDLARLLEQIEYGKKTGIKHRDLWGAEWWYWRKVKFSDPSLWEAMRVQLSGSSANEKAQ